MEQETQPEAQQEETVEQPVQEEYEHVKEEKPSFTQKFRTFIIECKRVLKITKKPTMFEYKTIVKASAIGMAVIGLVGFVITMIKQLLF